MTHPQDWDIPKIVQALIDDEPELIHECDELHHALIQAKELITNATNKTRKILKYKNFEGSIEQSVEDHIMYGKIRFINDLILYEGNTINELEQSFHTAVDEYLAFCQKHK